MIENSESNVGLERTRLNFADAVTRTFVFLKDLGFLQVEASPTFVRYCRNDVEVIVYWGRQSYELGFEIGYAGKKYSIYRLIEATDPEAARRYRTFAATTQQGLTKGLSQLEELARRYGQRAFVGDPATFITLDKLGKAWAEGYALEVLEGQLRPKAEEAFRRRDYRKAAELFERFRPRLSPADLVKLNIAKKRAD